jgi:SAM-dependent methyltransferase
MLFSVAKSTLSIPLVFEAYQALVGAPECHRRFIVNYVRPRQGDAILDVGCGTGASTRLLPQSASYTGIDISDAYIRRARTKHRDIGHFLVGDATDADTGLGGPYDLAYAFGLLHHLSDGQVAGLIRNLSQCLKPGGRFVSIDPCFVSHQHPIARFLISNDRGQFVRTPERLKGLFDESFSGSYCVVHDMLRIPYTQVILELVR